MMTMVLRDEQGYYANPRAGNAIASYRPRTDYSYDNNGSRIGSGNRLPGLVGTKPK
jgi:hypothetical protein